LSFALAFAHRHAQSVKKYETRCQRQGASMRTTSNVFVIFALSGLVAAGFEQAPQADRRNYKIAVQSMDGIFLMRADGSPPARLVLPQRGRLLPTSWSPDGRKIALWGLGRGLVVINVDGTGNEQLLENISLEPFFVWSPDSARIAFSSTFEDPARGGQQPGALPSSAVYVVDVQTWQFRRLSPFGQNRFVSWSPDGHRIAYSGTEPGAVKSDIYLVDPETGNVRRIVNAPTNNVQPLWSPQGDQIAFVAAPMPGVTTPDQSGVFTVRPDGSARRRIWPGLAESATWSPDSRFVLVRSDSAPIIELSTNATTELGSGMLDATFTPDGRRVIYRTPGPVGPVYAVDVNGSNRRKLADAFSFAVSPFLAR
jgi:Tol biopolymer transport system component